MAEPTPLDRYYTPAELRAAAVVWPQYEKVREREGRGPLYFGTAKNAWLREIDVRISKAEKRIAKMRMVRDAIEREWQPLAPVGQEGGDDA